LCSRRHVCDVLKCTRADNAVFVGTGETPKAQDSFFSECEFNFDACASLLSQISQRFEIGIPAATRALRSLSRSTRNDSGSFSFVYWNCDEFCAINFFLAHSVLERS
jgi:hypothetical protein